MLFQIQRLGAITDWIRAKVLSGASRDRIEKGIVSIALLSSFIHLFLITLGHFGYLGESPPELLADPIAALHTNQRAPQCAPSAGLFCPGHAQLWQLGG